MIAFYITFNNIANGNTLKIWLSNIESRGYKIFKRYATTFTYVQLLL